MAETNAFQRRPGELSNRIPTPTDWEVDGDSVWCLGSAEPGWTARLAPGDAAEVQQSATFTTTLYYRARARLRAPSQMPTGWSWEVYAERAGVELWKRVLEPGREVVDVEDVVLPTFGQASPHAILMGLRVVGPGGAAARDLELPGVFIADVEPITSNPLLLAHRTPTDGEEGVGQDSPIVFDVVDPLGVTPLANSTKVWAGETPAPLVLDTGLQPQNGWLVSTSVPATGILRVTLTPPALWDSQLQVEVEVESTSGPGRTLEASYSFEVEDVTAPRIQQVQARSQRVVRVTYSEEVGEGAELVDSYTITRLSAPAVDVVVQSASRVSSSVVDLTLDIAGTPRASYELLAVNVKDTAGNFIDAPYNTALFTGFEPPSPPGRRFQLWDMLPEMNREEDETGDLARFVGVFQEVLELLLADVDRWTEILDVDVAESRYLDHMLYQLGNPFTFELTDDDKRRLIRVLVAMYQQKGTAAGIINTIRFFLGLEVEVVALAAPDQVWELDEDELDEGTILAGNDRRFFYSFEVESAVVLTEVQRERIRAIVDYMKVAHEHFVRLVEPSTEPAVDHVELGLSQLGEDGGEDGDFILH